LKIERFKDSTVNLGNSITKPCFFQEHEMTRLAKNVIV